MKNKNRLLKITLSTIGALALTSVSHAATFVMEKRNTDFSIDGNRGGIQGQRLYLWNTNTNNTNQNWDQLTRSGGFFAYRKENTNLCWDGGNGGARGQAITLQTCSTNNQNQHWRKVKVFSGTEIYRLEKRNAPGFSIDGKGGGARLQELHLWSSNSNNVNQQWDFIRTDVSSGGTTGGTTGGGTTGGSSGGTGQFGLDPNAEPWENFDLQDWVIDTPAFASDGESQRFGENDWDDISNASRRFFFTHTDGGMRFVTRLDGAKTSSGTSYVRSELREMLRRGNRNISTTGVNRNNWALGYQPSGNQWGGRNGVLTATLRVNKVTTTGSGIHVGRTIIGQIHADDDEPLRLYYRKEPNHSRGCIYASHEIRNGDDVDFDIIGEEDCDNPSNGIALNELFSYEIINDDEDIIVRIRRGDSNGSIIGSTTIDMDRLDSGYDRSDEWMYFKAGAYTQNNRGSDSDGDIITFYRLTNSHD